VPFPQVARSRWLVDPDGQFKVYFDYVILALLLYSIIWVPIQIAFRYAP
jgi:hypothetical protein